MEMTLDRFDYYPPSGYVSCERPPRRHRFYAPTRRKIEYLHQAIASVFQEKTLEEWFNEHAEKWERETGIHSSPVIRFMHKDYQLIMAKGKVVIPYILNRMKTRPDDWFWALTHLAGDHDAAAGAGRSEEHTSELQSLRHL